MTSSKAFRIILSRHPELAKESVSKWAGVEKKLLGWLSDPSCFDADEEFMAPSIPSMHRALEAAQNFKAAAQNADLYAPPPLRVIGTGEGTVLFEYKDDDIGIYDMLEFFADRVEASSYQDGKNVGVFVNLYDDQEGAE